VVEAGGSAAEEGRLGTRLTNAVEGSIVEGVGGRVGKEWGWVLGVSAVCQV